MPTVFRVAGYRFSFFAADRDEPRHIHVTKGDGLAKFWLEPVSMQSSVGFTRPQLRFIERTITDNKDRLIYEWDHYFSQS
ncbi:MAG TPA: DUF4160 domain-containing protein [Candidatus Kapabacteria bacterium]|nr:DUF4160 domain-containing protein [Candidatus Kapabacteria bacterium]